jgi:hypothetical protein
MRLGAHEAAFRDRVVEPPQHEHLRAREQRTVELEDGFSVVAPTSVIVPSSITGRKESCWLRLRAMDFVDEQQVSLPRPAAHPRGPRTSSSVRNTGEHGGQLLEAHA